MLQKIIYKNKKPYVRMRDKRDWHEENVLKNAVMVTVETDVSHPHSSLAGLEMVFYCAREEIICGRK